MDSFQPMIGSLPRCGKLMEIQETRIDRELLDLTFARYGETWDDGCIETM